MSNLSQCLHAFLTEYLNYGVKHVVVCPGSRNFPIIKTAVGANKFVKLHSVVDERSAGFIALGLAQQSKSPVMVCCTSGTASLNLYPAIAEAFYSRTPLLVLTADRPAESIDNWEGQCIRQDGVFDKHVVSSYTTPENYNVAVDFQNIAKESINTALDQKGPIHVNMPFTEPFYDNWNLQPFNPSSNLDTQISYEVIPDRLKAELRSAKSILWLNGASRSKVEITYPANLTVWSDVISNKNQTQDYWESLLSQSDIDKLPKPDLLISTGTYCVSKKLRAYLKSVENLKHWHVTSDKSVPSPFGTNPTLIHCDLIELINSVKEHYTNSDFNDKLQKCNDVIRQLHEQSAWQDWNEMSAVRNLYEALPQDSILHIANSMPIRYVGLMPRRNGILHLANRGTSGIDGCTSTALGTALASDKKVVLFTGDLAFLYDINGLWQDTLPDNLYIVVFNNSGGGIFEIIDGPNQHVESLGYQTTNHNRSISELAAHFGLTYHFADTTQKLMELTNQMTESDKPGILEVKTDRAFNNGFYQDYKNAVESALKNGK